MFAKVKQNTCGNPKCVKWTKISLVSIIAMAFITIVILSLIPDSPVLAAIFATVEWIQGLPTILSMLIMIEVRVYFSLNKIIRKLM